MGTTTHIPVTVQHTVNPLHQVMSALFIFRIYCMLNHEFDRLGFVALYLVMTSNWFLLSSFVSDFKSHIFIYEEWLADSFLYALKRQVLHHSSGWFTKVLSLCFDSILDSYLVVDFFGFLWGVKKIWCRLCLWNNDNLCKKRKEKKRW